MKYKYLFEKKEKVLGIIFQNNRIRVFSNLNSFHLDTIELQRKFDSHF